MSQSRMQEMVSDSDGDIDLPPIVEEPKLKQVQNVANVTWQYIILAMATTGLDIYKDEICQLGLFYQGVQRCFKWCEHILPNRGFHSEASEINGFSKEIIDGKLSLCWKDKGNSSKTKTCRTYPVKTVMKHFQRQIRQFSLNGKRILLVVYNAQYDVNILFRTMNECGISTKFLTKLNIGFVDMYKLVKSMSNELPGIENFKQRTVYNHLFNDPQDKKHVHDVHKDVMTLLSIFKGSKLSHLPLETYLKHSSTAKSQYKRHVFNKGTHKRLQTMKGKLYCRKRGKKNVVCEKTARKIAAKGLEYEHLKKLHKKTSYSEFEKQMKQRGISKSTSKKLAEHFRSEPQLYRVHDF